MSSDVPYLVLLHTVFVYIGPGHTGLTDTLRSLLINLIKCIIYSMLKMYIG
jgi:hypothetical protein